MPSRFEYAYTVRRYDGGNAVEYVRSIAGSPVWDEIGTGYMFLSFAAAKFAASQLRGYVKKVTVRVTT